MRFSFFPFVIALTGCSMIEGSHVVSCEPVLGRDALRPAVCGKCHIKVEAGRLVITPAEDCPAYQVYRCTTRDGKSFFINNLGCKPYEEKK
ncbi:MAG: hypothetical protein ACK42C_02175 [Aquificaceae bacterium]